MSLVRHVLAAAFGVFVWLLFCAVDAAPYGQEIAIGDSIAVGLRLPGTSQIGIGPKVVLERIAAVPLDRLHGAVVILSTGLSNDHTQRAYVWIQVDALKAAGAKVVLLGVGTSIDQGDNLFLVNLARAENVALVWGWNGVHPADYRRLLAVLRDAECKSYKVCQA